MDIITSQHLEVGRIYSRNDLSKKFDFPTQRFSGNLFAPKGYRFIWLFCTAGNQYDNRFDGRFLDMAGQDKGLYDPKIIGHEAAGTEMVVFFRERDNQYAQYGHGFQYLGRFRYVSHHGDPPNRRFQLEALDEIPDSPIFPDSPTESTTNADLSQVCASFSQALQDSHLHFGPGHDTLVRSFVASLATKRFVILTGMSGSGKTQIAIRFGEWLGENQSLAVPVRPDWTGSESLLGYEDALRNTESDGRRPWFVPDPLAFMLKAARDPNRPYLLVLDEMNLAHVERYFADVLSGIESEKGCLPNLTNTGRKWLPAEVGPEKLPYPKNLFLVGTVNVDETTYMFSPKVLDRANTFEFRVRSADLNLDAKKPEKCQPGAPAMVAGFLAVAKDQNWHQHHKPSSLSDFAANLVKVHELLSESSFEFGHRVFFEAIRFACVAAEAGVQTAEEALDLQIFQKVLPRLHGTRKRLEPVLCALGKFCLDLNYEPGPKGSVKFNPLSELDHAPRLPQSFAKIKRMTDAVRINQFASFTE